MEKRSWQDILLPQGDEDHPWELFHENSKNGRHTPRLSEEEIKARIRELHESLPFEGFPKIELPSSLAPLKPSLEEALTARISGRNMTPCLVTLMQVATLLHFGYGVTRTNKETGLPRSFRIVPSGGALYPLEIFFYSARIEGLKAGLYHYSPSQHHLCLVREGEHARMVSESLLQPELGRGASLIIFLTAIFERSVFKYQDRGYRYILLEAGHVAQNINLVANALGFSSVNIGGFFDREIDGFLELDGITQSTIYMIAIGTPRSNVNE
jgi:SagB-type dehydrogenase family enzyme